MDHLQKHVFDYYSLLYNNRFTLSVLQVAANGAPSCVFQWFPTDAAAPLGALDCGAFVTIWLLLLLL